MSRLWERAVWRDLVAATLVLATSPALADSGATFASTVDGKTVELTATLLKPDGAGPFPAVVILHGCGGAGVRAGSWAVRWARTIVGEGWVAVIPDSFTARGFPDGVCTVSLTREQGAQLGPGARGIDAYAALAYLRTLPFVDGARVGIMGASHGGSTVLVAMADSRRTPVLIEPKRAGFTAGIALYPNCANRYGEWHIERGAGNRGPATAFHGTYKPIGPLMILIGEKDDWSPVESCEVLIDRARTAGYPVGIKVYPGAYHGFDSDNRTLYDPFRNNVNKPDGKGATTGGDPAAWADAIKQVKVFLGEHLAHH